MATLCARAQNMTDAAVMNDRSAAQQAVQTEWSAMEDSVFLHPDRIRMDHRCLQIEGKDVFMLSGTMHYFRVAEPLWRDRLVKLKNMGCNTVETYVPWNWHEREMPASPDDFSKIDLGELDRFLTMAEDLGLYVIVRPGPYICAEWKGGGFPQWIMRKRPKKTKYEVWLQSDDPEFLRWNEHWYKAVAEVTAPHQIWRRKPGTGGVILWQIENEYNRVKWVPKEAKRNYLEQLAMISRRNGIEVPFITCWTSEARDCKTGLLNGCVDMVNSYPRWQIEKGFGRLINQQLRSMPGKPLISGELQGGWYSAIGGKLSHEQEGVEAVQTQNITLYALQRGFCGLNFYMMVGGTNFGDWASREATATYGFAAAIGEDGSLTPRYDRLQQMSGFLKEYGTRIARATLTDIQAETGDSLVSVALRKSDNGDRYFFVRTEEHEQWHRGTVKADGLSFDYELEPFGSQVYFVPEEQSKGRWLPQAPLPPSEAPLPPGGGYKGSSIAYIPLGGTKGAEEYNGSSIAYTPLRGAGGPKWKPLKVGETIDQHGIYDYYPVYYKSRAKGGQKIDVGRTGEKVVNGSIGDRVTMMCGGKILKPLSEDKEKVTFRLPDDSGKKTDVYMLYLSPGLHHHTNKAVEEHWGIGPQWVKADGKDVALKYSLSAGGQGNLGLLRWFRYKFNNSANGVCHLHLEHTGDGFIYVNGKCIGRCWQQGPQRDYYIPECWLNKDGDNVIAVSLCHTSDGEPQVIKAEIRQKITSRRPVINAVSDNVNDVKHKIDTYVARHATNPEWILSRMAMYWKDGERYTQCYIGGERWQRGEGNAPVPTLRLPGERTWNKWRRPSLDELTPYNETGDLRCKDPNTGEERIVPYNQTGHSVRSINGEILQLAIDAAYVYWKTCEERYARFATDIFNQALLGVYYMNPVVNETPDDAEGKGGYEPGGILGYYDYEQIHDDIGGRLAAIYDYMADWLMAHPSEAMTATGKDTRRIMNEVMQRFVDLGMIRGGRTGNWNVNGWDIMLRPILVMEDNSYFADGKGREYFLHYLTEESTDHHSCIPDMLSQYDPVTGLWPESPGYGFGTALSIQSWAKPLMNYGIDILSSNGILQKALDAIPVWSDYRGNSICFGDFRGGRIGKESPVGKPGWTASSYSPFHRMAVLKDFDDPTFPMMACLYGGRKGSHLSPNGLAVQFYGFGYALAPDASAYESYWSDDYGYHQSNQGANTILQGYAEGDVTLNAMNPNVRMVDMSAGEKRRTVLMVKAGKGAGYYIDIFNPGMDTTDYVMHTVGTDLKIYPDRRSESCRAVWTVCDTIGVQMWISGGTKCEYSVKMNPSTYINPDLTPGGVSTCGKPTPTLYARQHTNTLYANVYEPYRNGKPCIKNVEWKYSKRQPVDIKITLVDGTIKLIKLSQVGVL